MHRYIKTAGFIVLYGGWVAPVALATDLALASLQSDPHRDSFPFLYFARELFSLGFIWLGVAIGVYVYRAERSRA